MKYFYNIVLFIFSPFYPLFFTFFSLNPVYFDSPYFYNILLFFILFFKFKSIKNILFLIVPFFTIFIIEFINFNRFFEYYNTLQVGFLKLFFYNTFHGGILSVVLIGSIFMSIGIESALKFVNNYTQILIKWMPLYLLIWFLFRFNILGNNIDETTLLLNNVSYYFLFIYIFRIYIDGITLNKYNFFILSILTLILYLNETRGALMILVFLFIYLLFLLLTKQSALKRNIVFLILIVLFIRTSFYYFDFIKSITYDLIDFVSNNTFNDFSDSKGVELGALDNENLFSNLSRIGTNLLSINIYLKNPLIGIGFYPSHNLRFLGDGIHSFLFYSLTSFGTIGFFCLLLIFKTLKLFFSTNDHLIFRYFLIIVLYLLMNQISPFILLIFFSKKGYFKLYKSI